MHEADISLASWVGMFYLLLFMETGCVACSLDMSERSSRSDFLISRQLYSQSESCHEHCSAAGVRIHRLLHVLVDKMRGENEHNWCQFSSAFPEVGVALTYITPVHKMSLAYFFCLAETAIH